jgi:hypothetical protein
MNPVAASVLDLTPEWLSEALGTVVTGVTAERVGTGQIGTSYRLSIAYAPGSSGPARLVAKLAAEDVSARARVAEGYRKEVGFYSLLASSVTVGTPRCWYGTISDDGTTFTLLLDDLAPARPGVQAAGCTRAEAEAALRNLVGLHAPRWNDPTLAQHAFLGLLDASGASFLGSIHVQATEEFVTRYADALDAADVATLRASAEATAAWMTTRPEPFALVHGDYRLDNLMFHPAGTVCALDWQTVTIGPPARDVAYFLGTSLLPDDRRAHETALVGTYHALLVAGGVRDYDAVQCFDDYRLGQLQGPLITVLGSEYATAVRTPEADGMFLAMARRSCAAIRDLASIDLVD